MHARFNGLAIEAASTGGGEGGLANAVWPTIKAEAIVASIPLIMFPPAFGLLQSESR
jgi:hypothetical protein